MRIWARFPGCGAAALLACALWPSSVWAQARTHLGAAPVLMSAPAPVDSQKTRSLRQSQESASGSAQTLAGMVVSAGDNHPLAYATVTLSLQRGGREIASATTDAGGRYHMRAQPAGRYHLRASAAGFRSQLYLEHAGFSTAIVLGKALPTEHLDFALVPGASIHGRVVDEAGEPVLRAQVQLYREAEATTAVAPEDATSHVQRAGTQQTDEDGRYEFADLQPGRYYVSFSATPWYAVHPPQDADRTVPPYRTAVDPVLDVVYPETFYPGATSEEGARAIALRAGQRVSANVNLVPQHSLSLQVQLPPQEDGAFGRRVPMLYRKVFGIEEPVNSGWTGYDRGANSITVGGLATGDYRLRTMEARGQDVTETTVSVGSGSSQTVDLPRAGGTGGLRVRLLTVDGSAVPEDLAVNAVRVGVGGLQTATVHKGIAEFSSLAAGAYRVQVTAEGDRWTSIRLRQDGKVVPSQQAQVVAGSTAEADVQVTPYAPSLHGTVQDAAHTLLPGAMVVLVPAGTDTGADLFRRDQSDLDGSFNLAAVPPGNYLLLAIRNGWGLPFANATALEPYLLHATPVVVPSSGPATMEIAESISVQSLR